MKRASIVILIALVAAVAARVAEPARQRLAHFSAALACGVEPWQIKTLQDRPRLLRARPSTVANLVSLPRPSQIPFASRLPTERRIFSVVAAVTLVRQEADQDLHLVLESGSDHMIAEAPLAPTCTQNATSYRKKQMASARAAVQLCSEARVVGVAFWDASSDRRCGKRDRAPPDSGVRLPVSTALVGDHASARAREPALEVGGHDRDGSRFAGWWS